MGDGGSSMNYFTNLVFVLQFLKLFWVLYITTNLNMLTVCLNILSSFRESDSASLPAKSSSQPSRETLASWAKKFLLTKNIKLSLLSCSPLTLTFKVSPETPGTSRPDVAATSATPEVVVRYVVVDRSSAHHLAPSISAKIRIALEVVSWHEVWRRNSEQTRRRSFRHLIHNSIVAMQLIVVGLVMNPRRALLVHVIVLHQRRWWPVHVDLMRQRKHVWHWEVSLI